MPKKIKQKYTPNDALFKKIMTEPTAAREFLAYYLPQDFQNMVDLSQIKIEKESFIDEELRRNLSDIVYSVKTNNDEKAFVYILIEAEVTPQYWIAFKLWKYILLLCDRHKQGREKLPLVMPIVFYHGTKKYTAPRNLWDLFENPTMANKLMGNDFLLVDLQSMSDDEIFHKKHLGMLEYFLKHVHKRDMIKLWDDFLARFRPEILVDAKLGYVYIRWFLWYTDAEVAKDRIL